MKTTNSLSGKYYATELTIWIICGCLCLLNLGIVNNITIPVLNLTLEDSIHLPKVLFVILFISAILLLLNWFEEEAWKKRYLYKGRYYFAWGISVLTSCLAYHIITRQTPFENIQWWWWIVFAFCGLLYSSSVYHLTVVLKLIPSKDIADRLAIPKISLWNKIHFKFCIVIFIIGSLTTITSFYFANKNYIVYFVAEILVIASSGFFQANAKKTFNREQQRNQYIDNLLYMMLNIDEAKKEIKIDHTDNTQTFVEKIHDHINEGFSTLKFQLLDEVHFEFTPELKITNKTHPGAEEVTILISNQSGSENMKVLVPLRNWIQYLQYNKESDLVSKEEDLATLLEQTSLSVLFVSLFSLKNVNKEAGIVTLAMGGHFFILQQILNVHKIDLNQRQGRGWTPLLAATAQNHLNIVKLLLEHGANPDVANLIGATPLMMASHHGYNQICAILLDYGANINLQDELGRTAFFVATVCGHIGIIKLLIDHHAKIGIPNNEGLKPIDIAYRSSNGEIARIIRKHTQQSISRKKKKKKK